MKIHCKLRGEAGRVAGGSLVSFGRLQGARTHRTALTLLEMMVAVTLLALIMIGLLGMFQQSQKALHIANAQSDVFENARASIHLIGRDVAEMSAYDDINVMNCEFIYRSSPAGTMVLPSGGNQPMDMNEIFWLTRANDEWRGVGYYVAEDNVGRSNVGVGTLYRYSVATNRYAVPFLQGGFRDTSVTNHRVADGIVHFSMEAVFVRTNGSGQVFYSRTNNWQAWSNVLPAFVDVELGVLEPATLKQFQSIASLNVPTAQNFLRQHEGRIHFFRERVPIRNFLNPYRANEVP